MKTLTVISGKGGTGKTTIVSVIHDLIPKAVMADCDVDAPNLHLILDHKGIYEKNFRGAKEAHIDPEICTQCGLCQRVCRFGAIDESSVVNSLKCEGCGACRLACETGAIELESVVTGSLRLDRTNRGLLAHALLNIGAEGSGKLVTEVRRLAEKHRTEEPWIIIDGSPGIGCSVIASITGTDYALAVTEPTPSGLSDLIRILDTCEHFEVPICVCINKADINHEITKQITSYCHEEGIPVVGKISYDQGIYSCLQQRMPVAEYSGLAGKQIRSMWQELWKIMKGSEL